MNGHFAQNGADLGAWADAVRDGRLPVVRGHAPTDDDRARGRIIRQLLCNPELPLAMVPERMTDALDALGQFEKDGLVSRAHDRIRVEPLGRFFLRSPCLPFDAYLPESDLRARAAESR